MKVAINTGRIRDLEGGSQRYKLRFDGITEYLHETWNAFEEKIKDVVKRNLVIIDIQNERAHVTATKSRKGKRSPTNCGY